VNISVLLVNGETDTYEDVQAAVDTDGALLVTEGELLPNDQGLPRNLVALYASGMWVRLEVT
jgi:hypothetical protein